MRDFLIFAAICLSLAGLCFTLAGRIDTDYHPAHDYTIRHAPRVHRVLTTD